jgi:hypothetical protein
MILSSLVALLLFLVLIDVILFLLFRQDIIKISRPSRKVLYVIPIS